MLRCRPAWSGQSLAAIVAGFALCWYSAEAAAKQRWAMPIPRVTAAELEANVTLRSGLHPYVLVDWAGSRWKASSWTLDYLKKKIAFEWVDFYPNNMADVGSKPYLLKFEEALPRFLQKGDSPKYMQLRLGLRGWTRLKKDIDPKPLPDIFWDDDEWIGDCMKSAETGKVDKPAVDNFFTTNQWKFLLIGEKGTQMFFHKDGTAASSWQAQLIGRKKWTLCPNSESHLLDVHLNTFDPDYQRFPRFAEAYCGQVTVMPGELLYYPAYFWHHPVQLDTPSVAYTGALVGTEAARGDLEGGATAQLQFFQDLQGKCEKCWQRGKSERVCDDISLKWPGAAPPPLRVVCDDYLPKCFELWDAHASSLHSSAKARSEL